MQETPQKSIMMPSKAPVKSKFQEIERGVMPCSDLWPEGASTETHI